MNKTQLLPSRSLQTCEDETQRWIRISGSKFFKKYICIFFIYLFLAALGLRCCAWAFSSCSDWGLLTAVASLVAEHGL